MEACDSSYSVDVIYSPYVTWEWRSSCDSKTYVMSLLTLSNSRNTHNESPAIVISRESFVLLNNAAVILSKIFEQYAFSSVAGRRVLI